MHGSQTVGKLQASILDIHGRLNTCGAIRATVQVNYVAEPAQQRTRGFADTAGVHFHMPRSLKSEGCLCCISELARVTKCPDHGSRFNFNRQMLRLSSVYCISETASLGSLHSEASFWTSIELMSPASYVDIRLACSPCGDFSKQE